MSKDDQTKELLEKMLADLYAKQVSVDTQHSGSYLAAQDGQFLGSLRPNRYDQDSIFNRYGPYGSRYSQTCIFNRYSPYGGRYSSLSPFNPYTSTPPQVYHGGQAIAYLTVNTRLKPRIDPDQIMDWAEQNVRKYG